MSLIQTAPPAGEPLGLADLKAFLRLDGVEEDALVLATAAAARAHLEAMTGRLFLRQGWRILRDAFPPTGRLTLPIGPILSLDAVTVAGDYRLVIRDAAGAARRTVETTEPAFLYASAAELADFGSALTAIRLSIAQLSAVAGEGRALEAVLPL